MSSFSSKPITCLARELWLLLPLFLLYLRNKKHTQHLTNNSSFQLLAPGSTPKQETAAWSQETSFLNSKMQVCHMAKKKCMHFPVLYVTTLLLLSICVLILFMCTEAGNQCLRITYWQRANLESPDIRAGTVTLQGIGK